MSDARTESESSSAGSLRFRKLNFDDVTVQHECVLPARPSVVERDGNLIKSRIVFWLAFWRNHPMETKFSMSSETARKEVMRQVYSRYWYIIHPMSRFRHHWDAFMSLVIWLLFLLIPFSYAFHQDLDKALWCFCSIEVLNSFCIIDIFFNFFTGYIRKQRDFVVLHHGSIFQNYLCGTFLFDFLSSLPLITIFCYFIEFGDGFQHQVMSITFHSLYFIKCLRIAAWNRMIKGIENFFRSIKLEPSTVLVAKLVLKTIFVMNLLICVYKVFVATVTFYFPEESNMIPDGDVAFLVDTRNSYASKYLLVWEDIAWLLFGLSSSDEINEFYGGKFIVTLASVVGYCYNTFIIVQILSLLSMLHAPRTKYYEIMNQLDAYMQMRQFPTHLRDRLRLFYVRKYRRAYFNETELMEILSEPLQGEIRLSAHRLFSDRVKLFQGFSTSLISRVAWSCKREQYLPNDLIIRAGSVGDCMFFILSGTVCVTNPNSIELCHLEYGDCFGEIEYVLKNYKRLANVRALDFCDVYILDYADFRKIFKYNEAILQRIQENADELRVSLQKAEEEQGRRLMAKIERESQDSSN